MRTEKEFQELVGAEMRKQHPCLLCGDLEAKCFGLCVPDEYKNHKLTLPDSIIKLFVYRLCRTCCNLDPADMIRQVEHKVRQRVAAVLS